MLRSREKFEDGWLFHWGDIPFEHRVKAGSTSGVTDCGRFVHQNYWEDVHTLEPGRDDYIDPGEWDAVRIPHDWCLDTQYANDSTRGPHSVFESEGGENGYLQTGVGCYRKVFRIPSEYAGRIVTIDFDGVFRDCTVWMNGELIGHHMSGYTSFSFDVTDHLRYGDEGRNVLFIRVNAGSYEGWFYEGAGIYRHVWLCTSDRLHVAQWGTFAYCPRIGEDAAETTVSNEIKNECYESKAFTLKTEIRDAEGTVVSKARSDHDCPALSDVQVTHSHRVSRPHLWDIHDPYRYTVVTEVYDGETLTDRTVTPLGIRYYTFTKQGFFLNGRHVIIQGMCLHQDFGGVGVAMPDRLIEYRLELIKEMGCNAYRSAHHPPTPEVLDFCDRMGILVMDENRKLVSAPWGLQDVSDMVRRDRNHPSVILWSLENEELLQGHTMGTRILRSLHHLVKKLDPSRPTVSGQNHFYKRNGYGDVTDIFGFNYGFREDLDLELHEQYPDMVSVETEDQGYVMTRGVYEMDPIRCYTPEYGMGYSWYNKIEEGWNRILDNPQLSGFFAWTAFDYRGEAYPYLYPQTMATFGAMDYTGQPKDYYYYYKANWTTEPLMHILPHWNWPNRAGELIPVWVFGNCEEVELFLNGESLGRQPMNSRRHNEWQVVYRPGRLEAVGYIGGIRAADAARVTTGGPNAIRMAPDRTVITADGADVSVVRVSIVDEHGSVVPYAGNDVAFCLKGTGARILGVCNGDPTSHEPDKPVTTRLRIDSSQHEYEILQRMDDDRVDTYPEGAYARRRAFNGHLMLLVQAGESAGEVVVKANSPGLLHASTTIAIV